MIIDNWRVDYTLEDDSLFMLHWKCSICNTTPYKRSIIASRSVCHELVIGERCTDCKGITDFDGFNRGAFQSLTRIFSIEEL